MPLSPPVPSWIVATGNSSLCVLYVTDTLKCGKVVFGKACYLLCGWVEWVASEV